ncbi:MAG: YidC/Oxa1 family membrane protein insertase [Caldilineaceae bacterium]
MKRKKWILIAVLLLVGALLLSGCGVSREGVDVTTTAPNGPWQTFVVWPMAKTLIWINDFLTAANFPYHWGFSIIIFTLAVKLITLPLTVQQVRGMQAQKDIQPKIQALQKKYGKDREKLAQEQMKLYREAGVNPLSGCLPLVIQMPILFGLYSSLVALGPHLVNANFFWIPDLGFPKYTQGMSWIMEDFNGGNYGHLAAYLVLPILLMASQYVMQKWMTPATPDASGGDQAAMMKQVTTMMTFMFGFFTLQVPAGLSLYWVTSNLLQMLQQWLITGNKAGSAASTDESTASAVVIDEDEELDDDAPSPSVNGAAANKSAAKSRTQRRRSKRR